LIHFYYKQFQSFYIGYSTKIEQITILDLYGYALFLLSIKWVGSPQNLFCKRCDGLLWLANEKNCDESLGISKVEIIFCYKFYIMFPSFTHRNNQSKSERHYLTTCITTLQLISSINVNVLSVKLDSPNITSQWCIQKWFCKHHL
jgi:hypothetical protein